MGALNSKTAPLVNKRLNDLSFKKLDGVVLGKESPTVVYLNLSGNRIRYLPKNLNTLTQLFLSSNKFSESVPNDLIDSIMTYENIRSLDLSYNNIKELPEMLISKDKLISINLFHNQFEEFDSTSSKDLAILMLGYNHFKKIPAVNSDLKQLFLEFNEIERFSIIHENLNILSFHPQQLL